jgi:small-conductance mechanosensitive channel
MFQKLFQLMDNEILKELINYAIGVVVVFLLFSVVYLILNRVIKNIEKRTVNELLNKLRKNLKMPVILLIIALSLAIPFSFTQVSDVIVSKANKVLTILIIVILAWISIRAVRLIKILVLKKYDIDQKDNLQARKVYTQFRIIERVLVFIIIIIAISLCLMTFSEIRKIGISLIASAGITGLILGFAAQKVLGSVLAGIQLAFAQPIRIDDVVIVENEWGRIEEINLTYVVVKIWDQRRLVVPTTYFIENPFQNWTKTSSDILGTVYIYTDYSVPFDELRKELTRLVKKSEYWDGKVNVLQVTNSTEKTIEVRALVSAADASSAWNLRVYVRENLIKFLQKNYPGSLPKSRVSISKEGDR